MEKEGTERPSTILTLKDFFGVQKTGHYADIRGFREEMRELSAEERRELADLILEGE